MALVNNPIELVVDKDLSIINKQVLPSGFEDYNFVGNTCAACVIFENQEIYDWLATNKTNLWFYQAIANWLYIGLKD